MDSIGNTQPDTQEIDRVGTAKLISFEKRKKRKRDMKFDTHCIVTGWISLGMWGK